VLYLFGPYNQFAIDLAFVGDVVDRCVILPSYNLAKSGLDVASDLELVLAINVDYFKFEPLLDFEDVVEDK